MFEFGGQKREVAGFRRGRYVTVRPLEEILETLDEEAKFEGLPFMPEMVPLCGKTFRVRRRADKTCVEGLGMRGMKGTVFLDELRCDGSAHDGCQRGCLFFWKEVWLKPADLSQRGVDPGGREREDAPAEELREKAAGLLPVTKSDRYCCQSTELAAATTDFPPGKLRHYLHDLRIGELSPRRFGYFLWMALANRLWQLLNGRYYYQLLGKENKTLEETLDLRPGELVKIKSRGEIEATLDSRGRNRGLSFEPEMALHCGRRYRVAAPLKKIIVEHNGRMVNLANTVILDGLVCRGLCMKNCPRANHLYWREIWLRRA